MGGIGETAEIADDMFDSPTNNADPFSFHLDDPNGVDSPPNNSESNPFDQMPLKEEYPTTEDQWLANQSTYEQPEYLGSITEELQLHRKPNIIQKAWAWFTGLW